MQHVQVNLLIAGQRPVEIVKLTIEFQKHDGIIHSPMNASPSMKGYQYCAHCF